MKAYGIPRHKDIENPDLSDGKFYAVSAHCVNIPGPGGDIRSNFKKSSAKKRIRRYWKKKARKNELSILNEYEEF